MLEDGDGLDREQRRPRVAQQHQFLWVVYTRKHRARPLCSGPGVGLAGSSPAHCHYAAARRPFVLLSLLDHDPEAFSRTNASTPSTGNRRSVPISMDGIAPSAMRESTNLREHLRCPARSCLVRRGLSPGWACFSCSSTQSSLARSSSSTSWDAGDWDPAVWRSSRESAFSGASSCALLIVMVKQQRWSRCGMSRKVRATAPRQKVCAPG